MKSDPQIRQECSKRGRRRLLSANKEKTSGTEGAMNRRVEENHKKYMRVGVVPETCMEGTASDGLPSSSAGGRTSDHRLLAEPNYRTTTDKEDEEESTLSELGPEDARVSLMGTETKLCANNDGNNEHKETLPAMIVQIVLPFFLAGFGMMAAGLLLDTVQHWSVYRDINELFILIPALLGLKGNLEMTLASRLSTAANVGQLSSWKNAWRLTWGNLALIQAQALVVAGLATVFSIVLGVDLTAFHQLLLGASAMGAASIASAILGIIMILVIILSHFIRVNPDNVATPIAASLGDLVTLGLLSLLAQAFYNSGAESSSWSVAVPWSSNDIINSSGSGEDDITPGPDLPLTTIYTNSTLSATPIVARSSSVLVFLLLLIPVCMLLAYKNTSTRSVLFYGWFPVISAMLISSGGGWVLAKAVSRWKGIAVYSPIINGVGGNLVAVQASRISTSLHQIGRPGHPVINPAYKYHGIHKTFFCGGVHARTARVLVSIVLPGSLIFLFVIDVLRAGHTTQSLLFYGGYIVCALLQVIILLLVADWLVHFIWKRGYDPDNIAIPFLTALGDLLGTGLLSIGFLLMWYVGDRDEDVGE